MFQSLSDRLGQVFEKLTKRGALTEADVNEAMREVRRSLIEADVPSTWCATSSSA